MIVNLAAGGNAVGHKISRRRFLIVASATVTGCLDNVDAVPLIREAGEGSCDLVNELGRYLTDESGNRLIVKTRS